jgi:homoserine dehydrogenase
MKTVTVGFLGCGNVGCGVWELLSGFAQELAHRSDLKIIIRKVLVRDVNKARNASVPKELLTTDPDDVLNDKDISIVVEFMGGEQPATAYMLRALQNKKTVVTANKVAVALHWPELQKAAQENGMGLYYEASVCGAIPIIQTLTESLQANRITKLMGIINGTTNYILSRMTQNGESYEPVLYDAQRLGLAEPDPASDVEGLDAAYKLSIMASLAFHARVPFDKVYCQGITEITAMDIACGKEMGLTLKLLAIAKRDGNTVEARVHPTFIHQSHPLAAVGGSFNAVYLYGHACRELMLQGRGAGDLPTASAVDSDLIHAATHGIHSHPTFINEANPSKEMRFSDDWESEYFIRMSAIDAPGVLSQVSGCFARHGVSIASMLQKESAEKGGHVPLIFITHKAREQAMLAALKELDPAIVEYHRMIRVEGKGIY